MDSGESRKFRLYSLVDFARAPWFVRAVPARRAFLSGGGDRTRTCMTFRSAVFKTAALPIMRPLRAWLPGTITHARELAQLRALRLGRPPCGKALPYRSNLSLFRRLRLNRCGGLASFFVSATERQSLSARMAAKPRRAYLFQVFGKWVKKAPMRSSELAI